MSAANNFSQQAHGSINSGEVIDLSMKHTTQDNNQHHPRSSSPYRNVKSTPEYNEHYENFKNYIRSPTRQLKVRGLKNIPPNFVSGNIIMKAIPEPIIEPGAADTCVIVFPYQNDSLANLSWSQYQQVMEVRKFYNNLISLENFHQKNQNFFQVQNMDYAHECINCNCGMNNVYPIGLQAPIAIPQMQLIPQPMIVPQIQLIPQPLAPQMNINTEFVPNPQFILPQFDFYAYPMHSNYGFNNVQCVNNIYYGW